MQLVNFDKAIEVDDDFITRNRLQFCQSDEVILDKMRKELDDPLGGRHSISVLWESLGAVARRDYLVDECKHDILPPPLQDTKELSQAFMDCLVMSWTLVGVPDADLHMKSIIELTTYLWLLGRTDMSDALVDAALEMYEPRGVPMIVAICKQLGVPYPSDLYTRATLRVDLGKPELEPRKENADAQD